jgi:hypothetical protein
MTTVYPCRDSGHPPNTLLDRERFIASAPSAEASRNRQQALAVIPLLGPELLAAAQAHGRDGTLLEVIDRGAPLVAYLMRQWQVSATAVKAILEAPLAWIGEPWPRMPQTLATLFDTLPPDYLPDSEAAWCHWRQYAETWLPHTGLRVLPLLMALAAYLTDCQHRLQRRCPPLLVNFPEVMAVLECLPAALVMRLRERVISG